MKKRTFVTSIFIILVILFFHTTTKFAEPNIPENNHVLNTTEVQSIHDDIVIPSGYEGVYIIVNKTHNTLKVYLNGNVVYRFMVATGKNNLLTPEGNFRIIAKVKEPWYLPKNIPGGDKKNPLGTRWLGLNVPNTGGYKFGIHGTNNPYSIGRHVSLGCIRMYNKDVEWLYRHLPLKTPVIITK